MAEDLPDVYLRLDGFQGECTDTKHRGADGWITIKSFTFGFGFPGVDGASEADEDTTSNGAGSTQPGQARGAATQPARPKRKRAPGSMKSGPMTFDNITFSKSSDSTSHRLMQWCHEGRDIAKVELHACRWGGEFGDEKMTFLELIFEKVHFKSCRLNLATDNLPSEEIEFTYKKVHMNCIWTDNATGARLTSQPISVGWDLADQKALDVVPPDDE